MGIMVHTSCEPWEKFRRAIFIPALTISWSLGTDRDAGPEQNMREDRAEITREVLSLINSDTSLYFCHIQMLLASYFY